MTLRPPPFVGIANETRVDILTGLLVCVFGSVDADADADVGVVVGVNGFCSCCV